MAGEIQAHFIGIDVALRELESKSLLVQETGKRALGAVAGAVERGAKERAPVKTGTLRLSIRSEPVKAELGGWSTRVYPTVIYARRIELGFRQADSRGRQYNQAGQPYLGPSVHEIRPRAARIFAEHWQNAWLA